MTKDPREEGSFEKSYIPAERTGDEEDMAGTVLYIASRAGAYLNGNVLVIVSCQFRDICSDSNPN